MRVSDQGLAFVAAHEGFVARGYLDPAGVVTIGYGFTMRSRIFSGWWRKAHGGALKVGDRLSREEANRLLLTLLDEEYAPPVRAALPDLGQAQFDACVSVVYNLGARALSWRWAKALRRGDVPEAARRLRATGTTAGGRRLAGLVRRRIDEARLLQSGDYGLVGRERTTADPDIKDLQRDLARLGFSPGSADGIIGPRTRAAVRAFQKANPPLAVDGVPGRATRAALRRARAARSSIAATGMVSALVAAAVSLAGTAPRAALALAAATFMAGLALAVFLRHRGRVRDLLRTALGAD